MVNTPRDFFRLNVGFIVHETIGYSREFPLEIPSAHLQPDLDLFDLSGTARVTRTAQGLLLQVKLGAAVPAQCGRCLSDCLQPLAVDFTELYAFTRNALTEGGYLMPENGKIDLEPLIYDEMVVAIPINPLCSKACKGLCPECGENLNEGICSHVEAG